MQKERLTIYRKVNTLFRVGRSKFCNKYNKKIHINKKIYYSNSNFYIVYKNWMKGLILILTIVGWFLNSIRINPSKATKIMLNNIISLRYYEKIHRRKLWR